MTCEEDTFKECVKVNWHYKVVHILFKNFSYLLCCPPFFLMQDHPNAYSMRNKPFPYFEDLTNVFGSDRAT
ncbi:hypothetical protein COCNU_01G013820 [Cocos nucifera]|uniref:Uncharacterized protein n=1 Tax=Cocos nucifera TaxID=13894 RepID=A0A8K0MVB5_COCNU|nr:hypothetical protein COCNU_01G013820 [Cocos nucifera]